MQGRIPVGEPGLFPLNSTALLCIIKLNNSSKNEQIYRWKMASSLYRAPKVVTIRECFWKRLFSMAFCGSGMRLRDAFFYAVSIE